MAMVWAVVRIMVMDNGHGSCLGIMVVIMDTFMGPG